MSAADPASRNTIVWVHEDCLRPGGPALARYPDAPAVAILDERALDEARASLKQIVFVYESLLEIPGIRIIKGDTVETLAAVARDGGCDGISTAESASPEVSRILRELESLGFSTEEVPDEPFVNLTPEEESGLDLKRFSRYWRSVKKRALHPSGG